MTLADIKTIMI